MPYLPPSQCAEPGCGAPVSPALGKRRCPQHERARNATIDANRDPATRKLYDGKWQKYAKQYRIKHPICRDPDGRHPLQRRGTEAVDHIRDHKGNYRLFWEPNNHQPLCRSCHDAKTMRELNDAR